MIGWMGGNGCLDVDVEMDVSMDGWRWNVWRISGDGCFNGWVEMECLDGWRWMFKWVGMDGWRWVGMDVWMGGDGRLDGWVELDV